jgi:hypothetical protein
MRSRQAICTRRNKYWPERRNLRFGMTQIIVSVHFPKAAGSSLSAAFQDYFADGLLLDYETDPLDPLHFRNIAPHLYPNGGVSIPKTIKAIHGHFHPNKYISFTDAYRVTFLREPVENLISIYYFWRLYNEKSHGVFRCFKQLKPDIFEFAEFPGVKRLMSQTYFGDVDMDSFDLIGFYDRRNVDLLTLSNDTGITIDPELYINETNDMERKSREAIMTDRVAMERLRSSLSDDCAFYNRLREQKN